MYKIIDERLLANKVAEFIAMTLDGEQIYEMLLEGWVGYNYTDSEHILSLAKEYRLIDELLEEIERLGLMSEALEIGAICVDED